MSKEPDLLLRKVQRLTFRAVPETIGGAGSSIWFIFEAATQQKGAFLFGLLPAIPLLSLGIVDWVRSQQLNREYSGNT